VIGCNKFCAGHVYRADEDQHWCTSERYNESAERNRLFVFCPSFLARSDPVSWGFPSAMRMQQALQRRFLLNDLSSALCCLFLSHI